MKVKPATADFARLYDSGEAQVVWSRLVADLETPVSAMLKLSEGRDNCFLLESVEGGAVRGTLLDHWNRARPDLQGDR